MRAFRLTKLDAQQSIGRTLPGAHQLGDDGNVIRNVFCNVICIGIRGLLAPYGCRENVWEIVRQFSRRGENGRDEQCDIEIEPWRGREKACPEIAVHAGELKRAQQSHELLNKYLHNIVAHLLATMPPVCFAFSQYMIMKR